MSKNDGIADLSYRHYAGTLGSHRGTWKVIAFSAARKSLKNKWFWILTAITGWYYVFLIAFLFVMDQMISSAASAAQSAGAPAAAATNSFAEQIFSQLVWKDQFLIGIQTNQMLWMIVALIVGAGSIANDSRSNALLVYLSKPCTKTDYLLGKWMSVFMPLFLSMAIPAAVFYFYGAMNYRVHGFLSDDPWLSIRVLVSCVVGAAFYTSLIIGFSSMVKRPALASAILGGVYILTYFLQQLMKVVSFMSHANKPVLAFAEQASYFSINGLVSGITKVILSTNGSPPFGQATRGGNPVIPRPDMFLSFGAVGLIIFLGIWVAWIRIRAVEVVK